MARIGYIQYAPVFGDREANFGTIRRLIESAGPADLLVLPELGATGYEFTDASEVAKFAEPFETGPTGALLKKLAADHNVTLVLGYAERAGDMLFNSCMLVQPDGSAANYRKIHLFSRENELFSPGDAPPPVIQTSFGRVGLMICFDWFFPETARVLAIKGAQVIAHPSNLVLSHCQRAMYARSVENGVFTITANRFGTEVRAGRELAFTGASQVLDTKGNTLASAPTEGEDAAVVEVDLAAADDKQINPHNNLIGSRRVQLYEGLV